MRQQRRSAKSKVQDLKRVLKSGLQAIQQEAADIMYFIIPGNGRSEDQPEDSWVVNGVTMSFEEYRQWHISKGFGDVERPSVSEAVIPESKSPSRQPQNQQQEPDSSKVRDQRPIASILPAPKKVEVIEEAEESWTEEDRKQYHREIGQRLIRPFKIG